MINRNDIINLHKLFEEIDKFIFHSSFIKKNEIDQQQQNYYLMALEEWFEMLDFFFYDFDKFEEFFIIGEKFIVLSMITEDTNFLYKRLERLLSLNYKDTKSLIDFVEVA